MSREQDSDFIFFANRAAQPEDANLPALVVEFGELSDADSQPLSGVIFSIEGDYSPVLSSRDARKLSKWLDRAADSLDGISASPKGKKKRRHKYDEEDEDDYAY